MLRLLQNTIFRGYEALFFRKLLYDFEAFAVPKKKKIEIWSEGSTFSD